MDTLKNWQLKKAPILNTIYQKLKLNKTTNIYIANIYIANKKILNNKEEKYLEPMI